MRIQRWVSASLVLLVVCVASFRPTRSVAAETPFDPKYPFETAILSFEFGGIQSGTATVWIDGDRMARHEKRTTTVMGMAQTQEEWTISTPEEVLIWEVGAPTAYRSTNPTAEMQEDYRKLSAAEQEVVRRNADIMGNVYLGALGGGKQSTGKFLGYDVDIVEVMGTKQFVLAGTALVVKQEGGVAGMEIKETATKIETDVDIPGDKFRLPENVKVVPSPAGDMASNVARSTFESLKDPNFEANWKARQAQAASAPAGAPAGQPDMAEMMKQMEEAMKRMQGGN